MYLTFEWSLLSVDSQSVSALDQNMIQLDKHEIMTIMLDNNEMDRESAFNGDH